MHLVVDRQHRAVVVDHVDRIVGAGDCRIRTSALGRPDAAGDQHRAVGQQRRDLRERVGLAGEEEREGRFRPDQMRHVRDAGRLRPARAVGQREVAAHHRLLLRIPELVVLLQIGLHDAQPHVVDDSRSAAAAGAPCRRLPWRPARARSAPARASGAGCRPDRRQARLAKHRPQSRRRSGPRGRSVRRSARASAGVASA